MTRFSEKQILWGMILLYIVIFGVVVSLRHYNFQTQTWDLGPFVQSFWNAANGHGLTNTLEQTSNHLGLHFSPGLFLLAPGYAVFPSPYYLLIIQTLALALGAWPLFLLAKRLLPGRWPLVITAAYLLYPSLHWANMYDFHEITFFVPLMLAALYFLHVERWGWMTVFLALAASMKEDAILAVLFVGIYLLIKKQWKIGLAVALISFVYFLLVVKVFMPVLGGGVLRLDRYENLGASPVEAVKNIITRPTLLPATILSGPKIVYLAWLLAPVAFLPFASWQTLILFLPGLPENLLTNYPFQFSGMYHYDSILIPAAFVGMIFGLKKVLERWPKREKIFQWCLIGLIAGGFLLRSPLGVFSFPASYFSDTPQWAAYRNLVKLVPDGVSVAANTNLVPHLANRAMIHQLGLETEPAEIVLIDGQDPFGFENPGAFQAYVDRYLALGSHAAFAFEGRYLVLLNKKYKLIPESK